MIEITGGFESLQKERKQVQIYDQDGRDITSFNTREIPEAIGFSLCGRLAVYGNGWVEILGLHENDELIAVEKLETPQFIRLKHENLILVGYSSSKRSFFSYSWENGQTLNSNYVQTCEFPAPAELKYNCFTLKQDQRPAEVLIDQIERNEPEIEPQNGLFYILAVSATGALYKIRPARIAGESDCEEVEEPELCSHRCFISKDLEERFTAVLTQVGEEYQTLNGLECRAGFADEFTHFNSMDEKEKQLPENKDFEILIKEMKKELGGNFDKNLECAKSGVIGILRIYNSDFTEQILEFELRKTGETGEFQQITPIGLIWAGISSPVIICRSKEPSCSFAAIPISKSALYSFELSKETELPPCCSEIDGARFITSSVFLLRPVIVPEEELFSPSKANSPLAHLFESYKSFSQNEFDADSLARTLEERNQDLKGLILQALQAAEYENAIEWAEEIYKAIKYLKMFLDDKFQITDEFVQRQYIAKRILDENEKYNWVSVGYLPVLKALISGCQEKVLYPKGELLSFSECACYLDSSTSTSEFKEFTFELYLTDSFVVSNKLWESSEFLQEAEIYTTAAELRYLSINNLISRLSLLELHAMAAEVCTLFEIPQNLVALDWIRQLLEQNAQASNEALLSKITAKKQQIPTLQFRQIALATVENGRPKLARMILESEVSIEAKVELNLAVGDFAAAIETALHGGNSSLAAQATAIAAESPQGVKQLIFYLFQNYEALRAFLAQNRQTRADLIYSIGAASIPQNAILMAESQFRKAFEVKSAKRAQTLIEETLNLAQQARTQYLEARKALKKQNFEGISLKAATDGALETLSNTLAEKNQENIPFYEYDYCDCQTELFEDSLHSCGPISLISICEEMNELQILQKEASEKLGKNLVGLTVIDTLANLYALKSDYFDKISEKIKVDPRVEFAAKFLGIAKTPDRLVEIQQLDKEKVVPAKFAFYASKSLNSMSAASTFCQMVKDVKMRFRMLLMIREDLECVKIFRQVGFVGLEEVLQEFYGNPTATTLIKKLLDELELTGETEIQKK